MVVTGRNIACYLALSWLLIGLTLPLPVTAQQQTGQTIPETRNPQDGPIQPFQQRGGLQEAVPHDVLRQNQRIMLPVGTPAQPEGQDDQPSDSKQPLAVVLGLVGLGLLGLWFTAKDSSKAASIPRTNPVEEPREPKTNKKKSKAKPRRR